MKRILTFAAVCAASVVVAEPSGDRPDATHAWAVHDVNRPDPVKISVPAGGVPSDATVLFDGTVESVVRNWRAVDGAATKWTTQDGTFVCTAGSGNVRTKETFEDCQLHVEWQTPKDDVYGWGNSGVYVGGVYEIQILDSSAIVPSRSPFKPANYADGQAGAVYGQSPCLVNPCRVPGEWQSFDIVFHPPRYDGARLVDPGEVTVFFNGVLVQDGWKLEGPTGWCRRSKVEKSLKEPAQPIRLQDHGHPVAFRNIWVRKIPSRLANTVSGGAYVKQGDVAALRHRLAGESLQFANTATNVFERYIRLWESYCYEPDRAVKNLLGPAEASCLSFLRTATHKEVMDGGFNAFKRFVKMLVATGWLEKDGQLEKALDAYCEPQKPTSSNLRDVFAGGLELERIVTMVH